MSNIGKIITVYDEDKNELGMFKFTTDQASKEHLNFIFKEYLKSDEDDLFLSVVWGIERIYADFAVHLL